MKSAAPKKTATRMSDAAVEAKTGKRWSEWFSILDKAGAQKMTHPEIAAVLREEHPVGPWWQQMVTVTYEQARGLRQKHQRPDGYSISTSRTIGVPVAIHFESWKEKRRRNRWLPGAAFTVRKATANKSLRITWVDGETSLEVGFVAKGRSKSQVAVQHSKLPDAKAATRMKSYWSAALDRLQEALER